MTPSSSMYKRALFRALQAGGRIVRASFSRRTTYRYKGPVSLLTPTDLASERAILKILRRSFPEHDILTEESRPVRRSSPSLWVVDPLDGTTNFAHNFPMVSVSIALLHQGKPVIGGVLDPIRNELFWAERGRGAYLNHQRIHVSRAAHLKEALLLTGFPYDRFERAPFYLKFWEAFIPRCHGVRRLGSAALDLAWVAGGRIDGFWEWKLHPWDTAAGWLLVQEAGGQMTDFSGQTFDPFGQETLASNGRIHKEMARVIQRVIRRSKKR